MTCGPLRSKGIEMAYWRGGIFPLFGDKGGWVLQASQKNIGNGDYLGDYWSSPNIMKFFGIRGGIESLLE